MCNDVSIVDGVVLLVSLESFSLLKVAAVPVVVSPSGGAGFEDEVSGALADIVSVVVVLGVAVIVVGVDGVPIVVIYC